MSSNQQSNSYGHTIAATPEVIRDLQTRIQKLVSRKNGEWIDTMTQLNYALTRGIQMGKGANWPSSPSVMRRAVNTVVSRLRNQGISTHFSRRTDRVRSRVVSFTARSAHKNA